MTIKNRIIKYIKFAGSTLELIFMVPFMLIGMIVALMVAGYHAGYNFIVEQLA